MSYCPIHVEDNTPPVAICDQFTVVALTDDDPLGIGLTKVAADVFDAIRILS